MNETSSVIEIDKIDTLQARPTYKLTIDNISALILRGFNQSQIADILNVTRQAVSQYIERNADIIRPLIDNTDNILAMRFKRHAIDYLDSIDNDTVQKASLLQRVTAAGITTDKYRLLSGQSTDNISVKITDDERMDLQQIAQEMARKSVQASKVDSISLDSKQDVNDEPDNG